MSKRCLVANNGGWLPIHTQAEVSGHPKVRTKNRLFWGVVQLAERRAVNPEVVGSSPTAPAIICIKKVTLF